jgi:hypothetical protein
MTSFVAEVPEALKVTGLPVNPDTAPVTVLLSVPDPDPTVQLFTVAMPLTSVLTVDPLAGLRVPPPAVTVKVTATDWIGFAPVSVTLTEGGAET